MLNFDNSYRRLPERFYAASSPEPVPAPELLLFNRVLAKQLGPGVQALESEAAGLLSGNRLPDGAEPIAMAYAGHQFGHFVPQLGDGRAILLGELIDPSGGRRDLQLKGSGRTRFSRRGDGRAALGPVLREYLVSEAMHALGIPTTRALAVVATGQQVARDSLLPGAVLTRVAASHIRVGTFQYFAARGDVEGLRLLCDHVIARHYPDLAGADRPALALLDAVADRQAELVADWLRVGFIHGVMNTDNMAVSGETIDYGPCAFMDRYDPATVFSAIDEGGRYAWARQPAIAQWNLARLAETLLPLIDDGQDRAVSLAGDSVDRFAARFQQAWLERLRRKLGLREQDDDDHALASELLAAMQAAGADYTNTFRSLGRLAADPVADIGAWPALEGLQHWLPRWQARLAREAADGEQRKARMDAANPAIIPRNHRVEQALKAAQEEGDLTVFQTLFAALQRPYEEHAVPAGLVDPPAPSEMVYRTFCGT